MFNIKKILRKIYYFGNKYQCPFCNKHARKFVDHKNTLPAIEKNDIVGMGYRKNCFRPFCSSKDRERLVFLFLRFKTDLLKKSMKVLHVAPDPKLRDFLENISGVDYIAGDKFSKGYRYKNTMEIDVTDLNFPDETFDLVVCNHVLEHIVDDSKAMREINRVLKTGGKAILQVPVSYKLEKTYEDDTVNTPEKREKEFGQKDHVRIYARDYINRLEAEGFEVKEYKIEGMQNIPNFKKFATNEKERIYFTVKK